MLIYPQDYFSLVFFSFFSSFFPLFSPLQFKERTVFSVNPLSTQIAPEETVELTVTAYLNDHLKFKDKLTIRVLQGINFSIPLRASGIGTTIMSEPKILPGVHLGTFFTHGQCKSTFTLTNRGRRPQALSWTTDGFSASLLKKTEMYIRRQDPDDIRVRQKIQAMVKDDKNEAFRKPVFQVVPDKMVLEPLESGSMVILGTVEE